MVPRNTTTAYRYVGFAHDFVFFYFSFFCFVVVQDGLEAYLPMAGLVDKEKERARLEKQAAKLTKDMEVLETRLGGSNFVVKVQTFLAV